MVVVGTGSIPGTAVPSSDDVVEVVGPSFGGFRDNNGDGRTPVFLLPRVD